MSITTDRFVDAGIDAHDAAELHTAFCQLATELASGDILDALHRCPALEAELVRWADRRRQRINASFEPPDPDDEPPPDTGPDPEPDPEPSDRWHTEARP